MAVVALPTPVVRSTETRGLVSALRDAIRGEVRFDTGTRAAYATDASNYRQVPIGVVIPVDVDDVVTAVGVCRRFGAPIVIRGGGTSLAGQCVNAAVVLDLSKYVNVIESVDVNRRMAVVQSGVVLDALNRAGRTAGGLVFGPKPATHDSCTIGGMLGNNSCGATAQWAGTTAANVRRLEVLTYDGVRMWVGPTTDEEFARILAGGGRKAEIYQQVRQLRDRYASLIRHKYPNIPRRVSGYNLPELLTDNGFNLARALVGSESTCVTILRAELTLLPEPTHVAMLLAGYDDIAAAALHVPEVNRHRPYVFEGLDHRLIRYDSHRRPAGSVVDELPHTGAWLMVKLTGDTPEETREKLDALRGDLIRAGGLRHWRVYPDAAEQAELDAVREAAPGTTSRVPGMPDAWPGWEDSAVPPEHLAAYLMDVRRLLDRFGWGSAALYGHFGHGCVHTSIPFDLLSEKGIADFREFITRAARLVVSYGGSLSGEHGDGQARGELLPLMFGDEMVSAFEEFKAIFDPDGKMNPGKVVAARPFDANLRLGPGYTPPAWPTHFSYPEDGGFDGVPTKCIGFGACRRQGSDAGVMCPSYQVTRDETHSTRGRMRLLFEMARGETITDGWHSEEVADALDLCLACKGCKSDCPATVDMATYKAEFLSHHFAGRSRPRSHYSLGFLPLWARLAGPVPAVANALTAPSAARALAGIDPRRLVPQLARRRFTDAFRAMPPGVRGSGERGSVLLWPDTFGNAFDPRIPAAATVVLEAAGFHVVIPQGTVCCGLTWISTGQLDIAGKVLRHSLSVLAPYLRKGLPVVGLEPSCTAVLRDDAVRLLGPDHEDARLLAEQTRTLAETLDDYAPDFAPQLPGNRRAIVQTHCHQHAVLGDEADRRVMRRIGLEATVLASGCCGLAGDFGMTPDHRAVSLACAERVLLPAVRDAEADTIVLADGFSCRTQIADGCDGRESRHLAELLAEAVNASRFAGA
jgi:FAD/FMN-containing dehydrogenase/Fe-S oxidoreductase